MTKKGISDFFRYARLRQDALTAKLAGVPKGQQSKDPVLNKYSFCNVFREDDKTTTWFRRNVRIPYDRTADVLPATVVFRMFNRIDIGEAIFSQRDLFDGRNAFEETLARNSVKPLRRAILAFKPNGPYVTGAYIISSPPGYSKLDGMLEVVDRFLKGTAEFRGVELNWLDMAEHLQKVRSKTLCETWEWLSHFDYFGKFHSYEIVTDLRHTRLLRNAGDVMTWANPGPGAKRGLNRIHGRPLGERLSREQLIDEMRAVLDVSRNPKFWPAYEKRWELREVEHTLCEFDKFCRAHEGSGRPRGVYR